VLRRYIAEQPTSRLAIWARRAALFSLIATILAIIIVRSGLLEFRPALATVGGALAFSAVALLLAFAAFVVIWREGLMGIGYSLTAIGIGIALLAYPSYLAVASYRLPWIYDITTDPIDPPRFEALARIRPRDANPVIYAGLSAAELQRNAYPEIETLEQEATAQASYEAALAVVTKRKWNIVARRPPERGREGRIEAVARTAIMGLREDVVIRVRADGRGSRIDMRSSSRYGSFDFGTNAARVRTLIDDIDDAVGRQKPEQPPALAKKAKAPVAKAPQSQPRNR
jgi:Protein of unknown function (DUF1499)